jgi:hypothetical protein
LAVEGPEKVIEPERMGEIGNQEGAEHERRHSPHGTRQLGWRDDCFVGVRMRAKVPDGNRRKTDKQYAAT